MSLEAGVLVPFLLVICMSAFVLSFLMCKNVSIYASIVFTLAALTLFNCIVNFNSLASWKMSEACFPLIYSQANMILPQSMP